MQSVTLEANSGSRREGKMCIISPAVECLECMSVSESRTPFWALKLLTEHHYPLPGV